MHYGDNTNASEDKKKVFSTNRQVLTRLHSTIMENVSNETLEKVCHMMR